MNRSIVLLVGGMLSVTCAMAAPSAPPLPPDAAAALAREENMAQALNAFTSACDTPQMPHAWQGVCARARRVAGNDEARRFIAREFTAVRIDGDELGKGLLTAYFVPEFRASLVRTPEFSWPLYGPPEGYVSGQLYPSRRDLEEAGKLPVVAWVATPYDAYRVGVQGSGRIRLDDGRVMNLEFAGTNGQRFKGLTSIMQGARVLPAGAVSLAAVERVVAARPAAQVAGWVRDNPRLTFFRVTDKRPVSGTLRLQEGLQAGRSCAVDARGVPLGALVVIDTVLPALNIPVTIVCGAHDTGGAIHGAHVDLYAGVGDGAGAFASGWHQPARIWRLIPRGDGDTDLDEVMRALQYGPAAGS